MHNCDIARIIKHFSIMEAKEYLSANLPQNFEAQILETLPQIDIAETKVKLKANSLI